MLIQPGDRVVDVGCGTGEEVVAMSLAADDVSAAGFDLSERNIAEARHRHVSRHVEFVLADCSRASTRRRQRRRVPNRAHGCNT